MTDRGLFRGAVLADLGLVAGQIAWSPAVPGSPDAMPASDWLHPVGVGAVIVLGLFTLASSIGLLFFRRWARPLYVVSLIAGLVLIAFDPGAPATGVQEALASLNMVVSGIVVALMYFSPARREFEDAAPAA